MARRNNNKRNNFKGKGKNGKYFNNNRHPKKFKDEVERSEDAREANSGSNDVSWMVLDANMLAGISNYNFITPTGRMISSYSDSVPEGSGNVQNKDAAIPGICRYDYIPTPGISTTNEGAPAQCAERMINLLTRKSGRIGTYDKADVFNAYFAATQPYLAINETKRMYRVLNGFSYYNEYTPEHLAESMGFDFDDWMEHYQEIPAKVNWWIKQIEFFALPEGSPILYKFLQLSDGIYKDSDTLYSQWYYFDAEVYWQLNDLGETGNELIPVPKHYSRLSSTPLTHLPIGEAPQWQERGLLTWNEWVLLIEGLIQSLRGSDSFKRIWDDFLRVYDTSAKIMLAPLEQGEKLIPFYDQEMINVVNAMRITPRAHLWNGDEDLGVWYPTIYANAEINAGYPIFRYLTRNPHAGHPQQGNTERYYMGAPAINTYVDTPSVQDMLYISQASPTYRLRTLSDQKSYWDVESCSVFLVTEANILTRVKKVNGYDTQTVKINCNVIPRVMVNGKSYTSDNQLEQIYEMNTFSVHPLLVSMPDPLAPTDTTSLSSPFRPLTTVDHIVFMTTARLKNFHEVQLIGFLRCPGWDYSNNRSDSK